MADIYEQDLALKNTITDADWIRLVTQTGNHRMTVGLFKDLIGFTALQQRTQVLEENALIEDWGSNGNWTWVKLSNGMMIAWGFQIISGTDWTLRSTSSGGGYYSPLTQYDLPPGFINTPLMIGSNLEAQVVNRASTLMSIRAVNNTKFQAILFAPATSTSDGRVHAIAFGYWK